MMDMAVLPSFRFSADRQNVGAVLVSHQTETTFAIVHFMVRRINPHLPRLFTADFPHDP